MSLEDIKNQLRDLIGVETRERDAPDGNGVIVEMVCVSCHQIITSRLLPEASTEADDARAGWQDSQVASLHCAQCWPEA